LCERHEAAQQRDEADEAWSTSELRSLSLCWADVAEAERRRTNMTYEPRLIGTWRSDRRRTGKDIAARRDIPAAKRPKLLAIFGQLTLRYTRTRCYSTFHGSKDVLPYRVLASNSDSVVLAGPGPLFEHDESIHHIHFGELGPRPRYYWVCLGSFREFFRTIAPPNNELQRTRDGRLPPRR